MIAAFSTSSHITSVALFTDLGKLVGYAEREQKFAASQLCVSLLDELLRTSDTLKTALSGYLADLGPGSFTGTRVAVVMAKTLGFIDGKPVGGIGSERLIHPTKTVVFPSKRDEWFIFRGGPPERSQSLPCEDVVGFGPGITNPVYPLARSFEHVWDQIEWSTASELVPRYWIDPSISQPNKPFPEKLRE